jgi:hypothetical protein
MTTGLIRPALARLQRDGWMQGAYTDGSSKCCVLGALLMEQVQANVEDGTVWTPDEVFNDSADGAEPPFSNTIHAASWALRSEGFTLASGLLGELLKEPEYHDADGDEMSLQSWNDDVDTTFEDVVALLTKAADIWEKP